MSSETQYVWYASYGSNLNADRFMCYIKGGTPAGSTRVEPGCRDQSVPLEESAFSINYPLYFAKEAAGWQGQGVGFLGLKPDAGCKTFSKKYLITLDQFFDVVKQENSGLRIEIDIEEVKEKGSVIYRRNAWYGNIVYLGDDKGYPIFTFTAPWDIEEEEWKKPSPAYLSTIINGLKTDYSSNEILEYLQTKPGIEGNYTDRELAALIGVRHE